MSGPAIFEVAPLRPYREAVIEALIDLDAQAAADVAPPSLKVRQIARAACAVFEVSYVDLVSRRRLRSIAYVRAAICWIARHTTRLSLPQIAAALDGCDHTSVLHRIDLAARLMRDREPYARAVLQTIELARKEAQS